MRWEALFDDLEAQLQAEQRSVLDSEVAERVRIERASVLLVDRLRAHVGQPLTLHSGTVRVAGRLEDVGSDFVLLADEGGGSSVVPLVGLQGLTGLGRAVAPAPGAVWRRLGLASALRGLSRDRATVRLVTDAGDVQGTLASVGADHVDVLLQDPGAREEPTAPRQTVPLAALRVVRSR